MGRGGLSLSFMGNFITKSAHVSLLQLVKNGLLNASANKNKLVSPRFEFIYEIGRVLINFALKLFVTATKILKTSQINDKPTNSPNINGIYIYIYSKGTKLTILTHFLGKYNIFV